MKKDQIVRTMCEVAVFAALGYGLDMLSGLYSHFLFPNGGSIGIAMVCVFFIAFRRGLISGIATGLIIGLLQLIGGVYVSGLADTGFKVFCQIALDYWLAYPMVGFAGVLTWKIRKATTGKEMAIYIGLGCLIGGLLKYLCHFLSGVLFWPDDLWGVGGSTIYSLLYNGSYMLPSIILCGAIMVFTGYKYPFFFGKEKGFDKAVKESETAEAQK
ncbi:MAG: energy-coupled thiamine transporter ThiT [Bacilli bacterium]|jgi:thiamine transporter|nr:energy-coupled thiamine transporter ThiT [Bacilli bacterium]